MNTVIAVAIGGAIGAVARLFVANWVHHWLGRGFPWGTLVINVSGSLLMGFLFYLFGERLTIHPSLRAAILVGGLGAYTTFSTFSIETLNLALNGAGRLALLNTLASVIMCLLAVWLGMWLARLL